MTASLQTYAREHMEAIDNLSFEYAILTKPPEEIKEAPADGVIVFGMYLEVQIRTRILILYNCSSQSKFCTAIPLWIHPIAFF